MSPRRCLIAFAWLSTLSLLAWAVTPERSHPTAPAWEWTTFASELGRAPGSAAPERWLAAETGGYAAPRGPRGSAGYRSRRVEVPDPPLAAQSAPVPAGAYVDLGR